MVEDVVINKASTIERAIARVREEHAGDRENLYARQTKQDAIILNLQRACEAAIDLAMHLVSTHRLGVPQDSREAFDLLAQRAIIDAALAEKLKRMVGFRNIAVHDYQKLSLPIVEAIIANGVADLLAFSKVALAQPG